ncbi:MAG: tRNA lysidine(34) synthetase TilS [Pseudomonadales bacterium]
MPLLSDDLYKRLFLHLTARRWLVAYSGGVDSHVLLHLLVHCPQHPLIEVVHINHQLQAESGRWAEHCQQQVDLLGIPLHSVAVDIKCGARESLEDKARQARYQVFESLLEPNDVLMLGHHLDDQVETLMLRLLRGSGSRGASAMPHTRPIGHGTLLRPLLDIPRSAIEYYAACKKLQWVEDASNQNSHFDRNFLRLELLPKMAERWPEYRQTLSRAAALNEESANLNAELAELDFHGLSLSPEDPSISLSALKELSVARQKNLLRYWLQTRGHPLPSAAQIQAVLDELVDARQDAEPLIEWSGVQIRRFKGELYAMEPLAEFNRAAIYPWDLSGSLALNGAGQLSFKSVTGAGINVSLLDSANVTVRFRQGGERCQPAGRSGSQTLKKLFQEYEVETWLRDRVPLLFCGDTLVAVGDYWVCEGFEVSSPEKGAEVVWEK